MKVRDIKQYRELLVQELAAINVNDENINLGSPTEQLRSVLYGIENIRTVVRELTSIAEKPYEQIFYEFLQNANDVGATCINIHFDQMGILVVNNGTPFLTTGEAERGQLRSFLRIRDFQAPQEGQLIIGRYGIGSRLLYAFLCDANESIPPTERLEQAIIDNNRGLVLFSWSELAQLEAIIYNGNNSIFNFSTNSIDTTYPLLTKILYSYYPAYLEECKNDIAGNRQNLFSREEFAQFHQALEQLREHNLVQFEQGSAIFIPFGQGVFEEIQARNTPALAKKLGTALRFLNNVQNMTINKERIGKTNGIFRTLNAENNFSILIPENTDDISVNFYQFLPILKTEASLGYVINTSQWSLQQSRQDIQWSDAYNQNLARFFSERICQEINNLRENHNATFRLFLQNFVQSNVLNGNVTIVTNFHDALRDTFSTQLPAVGNIYTIAENIKIKSTELNINPSDIGLDFHWLDESFKENYKHFKEKFKPLEECNISDLLLEADKENVIAWVNKLSKEDYKLLLSELKTKSLTLPFIKTSQGNVISRNELNNSENIIPLTAKTENLKAIFDAQSIEYTDIALLEFEDLLPSFDILDRLKKKIESIKANLNENQKYIIFKAFQTHFAGKEKELVIFKNRNDISYKLGELVRNETAIAPSGILYDFQIDPTEPYFNEYNDYFLKENAVWNLIRGNWERINLKADNFLRAIDDFNTLYFKSGNINNLDKNFDWISTINGFSNKENVFYQKTWADTITENDYKVLVEIIRKITDFKVLSFENLKKLSTVNFAELPTNGFTLIKDKIKIGVDTFTLSLDEIRVLNGIENSSFFDHFIITEEVENGFRLKIKQNNDVQFFTTDNDAKEFLAKQTSYYCLSKSLSILFDDTRLDFEKEVNVYKWVDKFGAKKEFFRLATKPENNSQYNTKDLYLKKLEAIELSSEIETYGNSFEENIIKLILERQEWIDAYRDKVSIDGKKSTEYIYQEKVNIVSIPSFSLSDLLPEYTESSRKLQSIKDKLVGISKSNLDRFFTTKEFNHSEIERKLKETGISNPKQLSFIIALRKDNPTKTINDFDITGLLDENILQNLYEHNLTCFSQFSNGKHWFTLPNYIDTQSNLFASDEKLPDFINNWRTTDAKKTQFLKEAELKTEESEIFKFRTALNENKGAKENINKIIESKYWSEKTQIWLKERFEDVFERSGSIYNTIQVFFDAYAEKYDIDNIFRLVVEKDEIMVKVSPYNSKGYAVKEIKKELKSVWKDVIQGKIDYIFYDVDDAKNISDKIVNEAKVEGEFIEDKNIPEWKDEKYEKWREILKNKYNIFFSTTELPFQYTLYLGSRQEAINKGYKNGLRAKKEENGIKKLFLFKEQGKNERKLLLENRDYLFSPTDDLTKLLELDYESETKPTNNSSDITISAAESQKLTHIQAYTEKDILEMTERFKL